MFTADIGIAAGIGEMVRNVPRPVIERGIESLFNPVILAVFTPVYVNRGRVLPQPSQGFRIDLAANILARRVSASCFKLPRELVIQIRIIFEQQSLRIT